MTRNKVIVLFLVAILSGVVTTGAQEAAARFSVQDFGAKGDGKTFGTQAIQKALDACEEAGGGIVRFPKGIYTSRHNNFGILSPVRYTCLSRAVFFSDDHT